jgi:1-deoxy-D-xylulose-5-phosphate synthase
MAVEAQGLLSNIKLPEDLRKLKASDLKEACENLRQFIVENAAKHGGHFAASLGVVELTIALHYIFNTPKDQIVWDVGHQAYGHKILTGRRDEFHTNRLYKGIHPFPKRAESEYDTFGVGHSSTSISAALGMAYAAQVAGDYETQHIAVIGDGSLTGGMAFEALNNAGVLDTNVLVILNDNDMAIDPNVGALKEYLTDITASKTYNKLRDEVSGLLGHFKKLGSHAKDAAGKMETAVKSMVSTQANFFESLGFHYYGPIDGHNVDHLCKILEHMKNIKGPKLLHISTIKGKGFSPAEADPLTWHAPGLFDKDSGEITKSPKPTQPQPPKYQDVFGHTLVELAEKNENIMGVTPAMPSGSSMKFMMDLMPKRAIDVGICEQHAVTFSAGMATKGKKVFCNIYSSFMQRAFDQVIHDCALQKLPVVFCLDRAGIAGSDGATHHGAYDVAFMRCIPEMVVAAPMNEIELRNLMYTSMLWNKGAFSIRYPRGTGVISDWRCDFEQFEVGKGRMLREGGDIAVITLGHPGNFAVEALDKLEAEGHKITHIDLRFVKPLDGEILKKVASKATKILTVEDGCLDGGAGSAVLEWLADNNFNHIEVKRLGIPDRYVEHGTQAELYDECGYDAKAIEASLRAWL